jgi:hypothetical protein
VSDERIRIFLAVRAGRDTLRRRPVTSLQLTFIFWHDGSRGNSQRSNSTGAHPAELIWLRRSGRTNCLPRECGVLWDLRDGPLTLLALQDACETNPGSLNTHLRDLREFGIVDHEDGGYRLTESGRASRRPSLVSKPGQNDGPLRCCSPSPPRPVPRASPSVRRPRLPERGSASIAVTTWTIS